MSRDSSSTYLHTHSSFHADLLETFTHPTSSTLAPEEIYVPPHHQPINPEDEDDVVPDQHAAFGIQRATQSKKEVAWRDFGIDELIRRGPGGGGNGVGGAGAGGAMGMRGMVQGREGRADEPVVLALRRRPGAGSGNTSLGMVNARSEMQSAGGGAGNGLPR